MNTEILTPSSTEKRTTASKTTTRAKKSAKVEYTLVSAIEKIWSEAHDSELTDEFFKKIKKPAEYIKKILDITPMQCVILATLVDSEGELTYRNIAHFTKSTKLKMLMYENEFEDLAKRRFIRVTSTWDRGERRKAFTLRTEAFSAIKENRQFIAVDPSKYTPKMFMKEVEALVNSLEDKTDNNSKLVLEELHYLVDETQQLEVCKYINSIDLIDCEFLLFFLMLKKIVTDNCNKIEREDYEEVIGDEFVTESLIARINGKSSPLSANCLIENAITDGIADNEQFEFTDEAKSTVLKEFNLVDKIHHSANVIQAEKICEKQLFYNKREDSQIEILKDLLSEEKFKGIRTRLKDSNLRMGFACLFYGAPGTGKTETVLQLAKMTGRAIMQVNISEIKSKWVGDSEKNIQSIFNQYKQAVRIAEKNKELVPILLFNEADAIISRRKEGAVNAVDKMENSIQNIILQEIENLDGILIATTNLTENLDSAFERRFLYKIRFDKPETEVKVQIWKSMVEDITEKDAYSLAENYDFSGGQIENSARKVAINNILYGSEVEIGALEKLCKEEVIAKETTRQRIGFSNR